MKLKLISFELCPYVHRATTMLYEKGAPFEIEYIDLANKPDWFLALSPRGKVPVLVADSTVLFESAVINEFVDEVFPPRLLPAEPLERARQRAWVEVANDLFASQYKITLASSKDEYQAAVAQNAEVLGRFESALGGDFFGGDRFGLVDAAAAPALHKFLILESHSAISFLRGFPKVEGWARRVAARPSVVQGVLPTFERKYVDALVRRGAYFARELLDGTPGAALRA